MEAIVALLAGTLSSPAAPHRALLDLALGGIGVPTLTVGFYSFFLAVILEMCIIKGKFKYNAYITF